MESSILVPITFLNNSKPTFRVSSIRITPDGRKLITSSLDGELSIWELNSVAPKIEPRNLLVGHSDPVTCIECTNDYVISASEGGEISRWNLNDGHCSKSVKTTFVHRKIQLFKTSSLEDDLLFTCGDYHEIFIIHSVFLQTILVLHSKTESDWISCFHVMSSLEIGHDVVSAVTKSSHIKLWIIEELSESASYEVQSSLLPVQNVKSIKCSLTQTNILTICDISWTIFDAKYLKTVCSAKRLCKEKFLGGDFLDSDVLIWTNESKFYLFKLTADGASLKIVFTNKTEVPDLFEPAMCHHSSVLGKFLVQCDISSNIAFWKVEGPNYNPEPYFTSELSSKLVSVRSNVFTKYMREVTCCVIISGLDLFVVGCMDGSIVVSSSLKTISSYSRSDPTDFDCKTLIAHKGRINCLLYPHEKYPYHNKSYLVSGGSDFSVCLWDVSTYKLIHKFCVQSGEIIKLITPPEECNARVRNSVCSVANDHSVAILNLKELKCIVLASRQLFPVVTINWRPLDDFIIIECFDGTVYIWEMETGHLDRVLHGVTAQEVIYACKESNHEDVSNFYLREDALLGKDHFRRGLFQIEKDLHVDRSEPVIVRGFLDSFHSESQVIAFNIDGVLGRLDKKHARMEIAEPEVYRRVCELTQAPAVTEKRSRRRLDSDPTDSKELASYLLGLLRDGDLETCVKYSLMSESHNVSIILSGEVHTEKFNTMRKVSVIALAYALESDCPSIDCELNLDILARLWQNKCLPVRNISRKLLTHKLSSQSVEARARLLESWLKYLPHFALVDGTSVNKFQIVDMRVIALVIFGVIGSDFKFKIDDPGKEELYLRETCSAILCSLQDSSLPELQGVATSLLGRGYPVWEPHLKFDKVFHLLFEMASEYEKMSDGSASGSDKCVSAHEALIAIAIARTEGFMSCLTKEISQVRGSQKPEMASSFEKWKPELVLIVTNLLERTPYMMLRHLDDIINILLFCVSASHLKQDVIWKLVPVLRKFKQVHQCLSAQRVAVGLQDGSVVIHELKTFKTHKISAHGETVSALMFSPDGKVLATYSYFENKLSFWHVFASIFGLGHVHVKCIKSYETSKIRDESVRNHFEIGELAWADNKSVILRLCDGNESVYHV